MTTAQGTPNMERVADALVKVMLWGLEHGLITESDLLPDEAEVVEIVQRYEMVGADELNSELVSS